jgi:hypothetical protein
VIPTRSPPPSHRARATTALPATPAARRPRRRPATSAIHTQVQDALIALVAIVASDPLFRATPEALGMGDPAYRLRWHLGRALMASTELPARLDDLNAARAARGELGSTPSRPGLTGHPGRARGCPDGTVRPPTAMGGARVPGHAGASDSSAAGGSGQGKAAPPAGTGAGSPLPGADSGEGGPFRLPSPPGPPEFAAAVGQPGS